MGKQINFFMLNTDEKDLLDYIFSQGDKIVDAKGNEINMNYLNKDIVYTGEAINPPPLIQFFIVSKESIIVKSKSNFIDQITSDVIEVSRSTIKHKNGEKTITSGRIWAEFKYYDSNRQLKKKEKWFQQKLNNYINWVKKNLTPNKDKDFFVGRNTYKKIKDENYKAMSGPQYKIYFE